VAEKTARRWTRAVLVWLCDLARYTAAFTLALWILHLAGMRIGG
jgi:hypothetical protein